MVLKVSGISIGYHEILGIQKQGILLHDVKRVKVSEEKGEKSCFFSTQQHESLMNKHFAWVARELCVCARVMAIVREIPSLPKQFSPIQSPMGSHQCISEGAAYCIYAYIYFILIYIFQK